MDGRTYHLPLPAVEPVRMPTQKELEYLVGFFDGDGCVTMKRTGCITLAVSQNFDSAEILVHFRVLLGGAVYHAAAPTCSKKAVLQWRLAGCKMRDAAATLSKVPSMKQAQLLIAAKASVVAKADRARVGKELKMLKQPEHQPDQSTQCLRSYFAGAFDAEGSIGVRSGWVGLSLEVGQVNPCMLVRLLRFLHENQLTTWSLYHKKAAFVLVCNNLHDCKQTLELLLANGLLVKRQQANLALAVSAENHLQIRDAVSRLNGWQQRYHRLDSAGIARAREISRLGAKLRRMASGLEYASLQCELDKLRSAHALQGIIGRCNLLRKDMRKALRDGGQVTQTSSE